VTIIAGFIAPMSVSLVGFLMFGNLLRECGCLDRLSETAQNTLANLITLLLGITISFSMRADQFVSRNTLIIMGLGLVAFVFDSIAGVMFAKLLNLFSKKKVNPMVGAAGISAFPMSARVIQKMGIEADREPSADARGGCERGRADRKRPRGRHDPEPCAAALEVRRKGI